MTRSVKELKKKLAKIVKKMLKFKMLKFCKTLHCIKNLYSNLFSNPRRFQAPGSGKNPKRKVKIQKKRKKIERFVKKNS